MKERGRRLVNGLGGATVMLGTWFVYSGVLGHELHPADELLPLQGGVNGPPLARMALALETQFGTARHLACRATSLVVHALSALLVFFVVRHGLRQNGEDTQGLRRQWSLAVAGVAALFFAWHPLNGQTLNVLHGQGVLLATLLSAGGIWLLGFHHVGLQGGRLALGCGLLVLAALADTTALLLPPVLVFVDWTSTRSRADSSRERRAMQVRTACLLSSVALAVWVLTASDAWPALDGLSVERVFEHVLTQLTATVFYYGRALAWPFGLSAMPEFPEIRTPFDPRVALSLLIMGGVGKLVFRLRSNRDAYCWALWAISSLGFACLFSFGLETVLHQRAHASLFCCAILGGLALGHLRSVIEQRVRERPRARLAVNVACLSVIAGIVVVCGVHSRQRNAAWASPLTRLQDAASRTNDWQVHLDLGHAYREQGSHEESLIAFERALEMRDNATVHVNVGLTHLRLGQNARGLEHLEAAVAAQPESADPLYYLGYGLAQDNALKAATSSLERALVLRPSHQAARDLLEDVSERSVRESQATAHVLRRARTMLAAGNPAAAITLLEPRVHVLPRDVELRFALAFALQQARRRDVAIEHYQELLRFAPHHVRGHFNLAWLYMQGTTVRDWTRSATLYRRCLELDPAYFEVDHRLATVYWQLGDLEEAQAADQRYLRRGKHSGLKRTSAQRLAKH